MLSADPLDRPVDPHPHVVHFCARLPVGGMENVLVCLFRRVPPADFRSTIWCLEEGDVQGRELLAAGEPILELHKRPGRDARMFLRVARLLERQAVDVLHCHDELSWFYGTVAALLTRRRVRIVVTMHGRRPNISARHLIEQRLLARRTSVVVSVSGFLRQQLLRELRLADDRVITITNGIAIATDMPTPDERRGARQALGVPESAFVMGSVGELSRVKNLDLMLESAALVARAQRDLTLLLIGEGGERDRLQRKAADLGISDRTAFAGLRRNVPQLLPAFDVYVCSSHYEGVSLSILEAMGRGLSVAATAVGGNPELIEDGVTGLLVPPGEREAMSTAILRLSGDPAMRTALGSAARRFVLDAFSVDRMVSDYARLYRRVLGSASSAEASRFVSSR